MQVREAAVATLLGAVVSTAVVGVLLTWPPDLSTAATAQTPSNFLPPVVGMGLLAGVLFGPSIVRAFRDWLRTSLRPLDVFLGALGIGLASAPLWSRLVVETVPDSVGVICVPLGTLSIASFLAHSTMFLIRGRRSPDSTLRGESEYAVLEKVMSSAGLEPMLDLDLDDALDRGAFVETLEAAVRQPRQHAPTFGLNGPWGSGKTTILNALAKRLEAHKVVVVRFDAWSFREPERLISHYVAQLSTALRRAGAMRAQTAAIRRLALGIAPLAGSRFADAARFWLADDDASTRKQLAELRGALQNLRSQVVVIGDDLDRLERDELHAALRAFRLFSDLPRVVHVLAYDRRQLSRILFPEDSSGQLARDYLGKVVHVELSLSTPTPESAWRLLGVALQPLLEAVGKEEADKFVERLNSVPRQLFIEAMPTPRDVRRAAIAIALLWPRLGRVVNLFDLFVLQVIQSRFPQLYQTIHAHPQWFTEQEWSGDLWRISEGDRWTSESAALMTRLRTSDDPENLTAARLLSLILAVPREGGTIVHDEARARRERRILHPDVFPRYFQLSVPREQIAEATLEDLANQIKMAVPSTRVAVFQNALDAAIKKGQLQAMFEQWDILVDRLFDGASSSEASTIARDVAVGLAMRADQFVGDYNDPLNPVRTAAFRILSLAIRAGSNERVTDVVCAAITESTSFGLSGSLVFYTTTPDRRPRELEQRSLDESRIRGEFDKQVRLRLVQDRRPLFTLPDEDIGEVIYRSSPYIVRDVVTRALHEQPSELPRLLRFALTLRVNRADLDDIEVFQDNLAALHQRVNLREVFQITETLKLSYWDDLYARALVQYFRGHYEAVVAKAEGQSQT